ncbi:hypothetical protein HN51_055459, partial [Arachis hypogaea]
KTRSRDQNPPPFLHSAIHSSEAKEPRILALIVVVVLRSSASPPSSAPPLLPLPRFFLEPRTPNMLETYS